MNYGERLKLAREHAGLSQDELASRVGIKQPSLSYLENPKSKATGSEHTVRFARACGVNVDWLSDETGQMMSGSYPLSDHREMLLQQPQAEYLVDRKTNSSPRVQSIIDALRKNSDNTDLLDLIEQVIVSMTGKSAKKTTEAPPQQGAQTENGEIIHRSLSVPGVTVDVDEDGEIEIKKSKNKAANG